RIENKEKAAFLDLLYRRLGSKSFNDFVAIKIKSIQQKLGITKNNVLKGLQLLQDNDHLLQFEMFGERPLVRPIHKRFSSLPVKKSEVEAGRKRLLKKLDYMKSYTETEICRERYIRRYFGENINTGCDHCDNCLKRDQKKEKIFSDQDMVRLKQSVGEEGISLKTIQNKLQMPAQKVKQVVRFLMREEKIRVEEDKV